jgi:glycosyltransferase involved in cell wall biosynthesis
MSFTLNGSESGRLELPRLLMTAYRYDRAHSMESRLSWQRAQHAAEEYDVTVICARGEPSDGGVNVVELPLNRVERALMARTVTYYLGYRQWHRRVFQHARRLHAQRRFDLVHQVSFCGYREPGDCWRLGAPFVWGPVGGTRPFPLAFIRELDFRGAVRELMRNIVNAGQLHFGRRVRRAMRSSASVMAANREVAHDLSRCYGVIPRVQLETGISTVRATPRSPRDPSEPLRILWSGRLRAWKGLPLLLRALAQLPADCRYVLRVMGQGSSQEHWNALAERLGVADNIEWAGWPDYAGQLPHYDWADVFAFTSMRDTSGTGLLEALAAGLPIVGLDHQGAADIMTEECAMRVPATSSEAAVQGLRDAVLRLSSDASLLSRLSAGAIQRADYYHWDRQWEVMREVYREALAAIAANKLPAGANPTPTSRREPEPALAASPAASNAYC